MLVLSIEHSSDSLRGYLTRHLQSIKSGIYVGNINARIRQEIVNKIEAELEEHGTISALLVYNDANELGYTVKSIGDPSKKIINYDGLDLLATIDNRNLLERFAYSLWAKLTPYKSLYHHMYETGMLCKALLEKTTYSPLVDLFHSYMFKDDDTFMSNTDIIQTVSFLIACHDIGKASAGFQKKALESDDYHIEFVLDTIAKEKMECGLTKSDGFRHEIVSSIIMKDYLKECGLDSRTVRGISEVYKNHHLTLVEDESYSKIFEEENKEKWDKVNHILLDKLKADFDPALPFAVKKEFRNIFDTLLLSLMYRCDWMASSLFSQEVTKDQSYAEYVQQTIDEYISYLGIHKIEYNEIKNVTSIKELFPFLKKLRPLQSQAERIGNSDMEWECAIIEDETGSGKTEAGVYLAYKAMLSHGKQGIYFGLPTGTTEEAMNPRIQQCLDELFPGHKIKVRHASQRSWLLNDNDVEDDEKDVRFENTTHRLQKLMYPYATGTVDQIELGVLRNKFAIIQLMDLSTKVVIIDEMHAYDAYMRGVLFRSLEWLKAYHVPVVIMSATLPDIIKKDIYKVYSKEPFTHVDAYPLVTLLGNTVTTYPVISTKQKELFFDCKQIYDSDEAILTLSQETIKDGGNLAIIVNSVKKAIALYDLAVKTLDTSKIPVLLFQGRVTLEAKEKNTKKLLSLYSKQAKEKGFRPEKSIVIATQLLEQSIDVDFDYMISELAPIDLLLQRAGRLRRHNDKGTVREKHPSLKELIVLTSKNFDDFTVYAKQNHTYLLEKTQAYLEAYKCIIVPSDMRSAIEEVYDKEIEKDALLNTQGKISTIDKPTLNEELPFEKGSLENDFTTRLSSYKTKKVAVISDDSEYDLKTLTGKSLLDKSKDILYKNVVEVLDWFVENEKYVEGSGYLKDVIFLSESDFFMSEDKGLQIVHS